jgi:hypothetical protein
MSDGQIAKAIRCRVGIAHSQWYGTSPNMPVADFDVMVAVLLLCNNWAPADILLCILGGWLWAKDATNPLTATASRECAANLRALTETGSKEHLSLIDDIQSELIQHADEDYKTMFVEADLGVIDEWWAYQLVSRRPSAASAPIQLPDSPGSSLPAPESTSGKRSQQAR